MAVLRADVDFEFEGLQKLARIYPELNGRFLSLVGKRSRILLKEQYLSGQEIDLRKFPKDKRGRYTIVSDVNKRRTSVKIWSFPVNLFERSRTWSNGRREAGKYIITRKLKKAVAARMAGYVNEFERKILNEEIKKVGLS